MPCEIVFFSYSVRLFLNITFVSLVHAHLIYHASQPERTSEEQAEGEGSQCLRSAWLDFGRGRYLDRFLPWGYRTWSVGLFLPSQVQLSLGWHIFGWYFQGRFLLICAMLFYHYSAACSFS